MIDSPIVKAYKEEDWTIELILLEKIQLLVASIEAEEKKIESVPIEIPKGADLVDLIQAENKKQGLRTTLTGQLIVPKMTSNSKIFLYIILF